MQTRDMVATSTDVRPERPKPPLKWAGGKRWLAPHIRPLWKRRGNASRLVEPFCGGLAVALELSPERALLNDINPHLINFYRWLASGLTPASRMLNDSDAYYKDRERFNALLSNGSADSQEAAQLFYYLNRTGYNGLCRFNQSGGFNVPFGKYKTINYARDFTEYTSAFAKWEFTSMDFADVPLAPDDFVYADPPYDVDFTQYSKEGFDWDDQVRLAELLAKHTGPVVMSNQATKRIVQLYRKLGFRLRYLQAPRMISCNGDRTPAREVLATKGF